MIVVADTGPLNYLLRLRIIHLLHALYDQVLIPHAVLAELEAPGAPEPVREWARNLPIWVKVVPVRVDQRLLDRLHPGESEAISLSLHVKPAFLLIDERAGRKEAEELGVTIAGTLSVLFKLAESGLVDFPTVLRDLQNEGFYLGKDLQARLLVSFGNP